MYIQSDSCYCPEQCMYDPDGSWCYTHRIRENEHNREIHNTLHMRTQVAYAVQGLIDSMRDEEFEFTEIHVTTDPISPSMKVYAKGGNGKLFMYAAYINESGDVQFDGF